MDKYTELISIFGEILEKSKDYHIAHIYHIGYASIIGLHDGNSDLSLQIEEVFSSPEAMADSLLRNWKWQWFYENRGVIGDKDYNDIVELDDDIPVHLQAEYLKRLKRLQDKIRFVLE